MSVNMKFVSKSSLKMEEIEWQLLDLNGGSDVLIAPALALIKKLHHGLLPRDSWGVRACEDLITLDEVMRVLDPRTVHAGTYNNAAPSPWLRVLSDELLGHTPPKILAFHVGDPSMRIASCLW